jgi:hypothetical protein
MAKIRINSNGRKFLLKCKEALDPDEFETVADILEAYQAKDHRTIGGLRIADVLDREHHDLLAKVFAWSTLKATLPTNKPKK